MSVGLLRVGLPYRSAGYADSFGVPRQLVLVALCLLWFIPGLTGRLPWKPVEVEMVPAVAETAAAGDFTVPRLLGEPYLELAPVPAMLAAAGPKLLGSLLPAHEAMRLGNVVWLLLGFGLSGLVLSRRRGSRAGWRMVLLMLGSPALLLHARTVNPDLALLAVAASGMAGMMLRKESPLYGTIILGLTALIGVWCAGLIALWFTALLAASLLPIGHWRDHEPFSVISCVAVFLFCFIGLAIWLSALSSADAEVPVQVGLAQLSALNLWTILVSLQKMISTSAWALWPALPLAALALLRKRSERSEELRLGISLLTAGVLALLLTGFDQDSKIFLLLPGIAMMAATSLTRISREIAKALDWFAILVIGSGLIGFLWIAWLLAQTGAAPVMNAWLAERGIENPGFSWHVIAALFASLTWIAMVLRIGRSPERSVLNWVAGTTMGWLVFSLLWLSAVDKAKGYAEPAGELRAAAEDLPCVQTIGIQKSVAAQLEYFSGVRLRGQPDCEYKLITAQSASSEEGVVLWSGARPADDPNKRLLLVAAHI